MNIIISSYAGGGKTAVSKIVEEALRNAGFNVTNNDPDKSIKQDLELAKITLSRLIDIQINTVQLSRASK